MQPRARLRVDSTVGTWVDRVLRIRSPIAVVGLAALVACDPRPRECERLAASVRDDLDADLQEVLRLGEDEAYLASQVDPSASRTAHEQRMIENAGLETRPTDEDLRAARAAAKAELERGARAAHTKLRKGVDARFGSFCAGLSDAAAKCRAEYPARMAELDAEQRRRCDALDADCHVAVRAEWDDAHPDCKRLADHIDVFLASVD